METTLTTEDVAKCLQNTQWHLTNKVLYDLCAQHFTHERVEDIIAKALLIGRAYAASIERRKNKKAINDNFYVDTVVPIFQRPLLDKILAELKGQHLSVNTLPVIIDAHYFLTKILFEITELEKRSFSSKYLHFHLPHLFFIYDSRAVTAMRAFVKKLPEHLKSLSDRESVDREYSIFACKCLHFQQSIFEQHNILLNPRQLDNLLINTANKRMALLKGWQGRGK